MEIFVFAAVNQQPNGPAAVACVLLMNNQGSPPLHLFGMSSTDPALCCSLLRRCRGNWSLTKPLPTRRRKAYLAARFLGQRRGLWRLSAAIDARRVILTRSLPPGGCASYYGEFVQRCGREPPNRIQTLCRRRKEKRC